MVKSQQGLVAEPARSPHRHIAGLIFHLSRDLATTLDRHMAPFNVTGQQAALLLRSCAVPDATPTQLALWLGTDNPGMTRLLDRLETKGLVQRRTNPTDRRAIVVEPTDAGQTLAPDLSSTFRTVFSQLVDGIAPDELTVLESLLRRLRNNVELHAEGDGPE